VLVVVGMTHHGDGGEKRAGLSGLEVVLADMDFARPGSNLVLGCAAKSAARCLHKPCVVLEAVGGQARVMFWCGRGC